MATYIHINHITNKHAYVDTVDMYIAMHLQCSELKTGAPLISHNAVCKNDHIPSSYVINIKLVSALLDIHCQKYVYFLL